MMKTVKHDIMRTTNTLSLLDCIRDYGPLTKGEIQEKTGLSWGAICNIISELLKSRIISECMSTEFAVGRTPSKFDINSNDRLIIGIDINIEGLTAVLIDLKCRVLNSIRVAIMENEKEEVLKQAKCIIHQLLDSTRIDRDKIIGIGIAMQGTVNSDEGVSVYSPYFNNWDNIPLKDIFEKEFNLPVCVEHDPNCMAMTERWLGGAKDVKDMLFIRLSMGIGMSIIINGEIYRGVDGSAGEFGHITINPDGARCTCGNYGCLEVYASGRSILQQTREGLKLRRTTLEIGLEKDNEAINLSTVANAARKGDAYLRSIFENAGIFLGIGISNMINIFNPEMVIIGGELGKFADLYLDKAREIAKQKAWKNSRINILASQFESDSAAIGAAAVYVQKIFSGNVHLIMKS